MKLHHCTGILLTWLALITRAIGNSNQPSELNVISHLGNLYTNIYGADPEEKN
jgi:hypothetical protein